MQANRSDVVKVLEERFLPILQNFSTELSGEFRGVEVNCWSSPVGSLTEFQGYDIGIECFFPDAPANQPDNVALSISVMHLTTNPMIHSVDVCWGDGTLEEELISEPVDVSDEVWMKIKRGLPTLFDAFKAAISRKGPREVEY